MAVFLFMQAEQHIPLRLASSNANKLLQFSRNTPRNTDSHGMTALFNEEEIKRKVVVPETEGFDYVASISQTKLEDQRIRLRQTEGNDTDYVIVVSDSCLIYPDNKGRYIALNRDGIGDDAARVASETIKQQKEIVFTGAVSFGRKLGISNLTVLSYVKCFLPEGADFRLPIKIDELPGLVDTERGFEFGYIDFKTDPNNEKLKPVFKPKTRTHDFSLVRPFVSGLTPEVLEMVEGNGVVDRDIAPLVEMMVANFPFNTLSFYTESKRFYGSVDGDLNSFYRHLMQNWEDYFRVFGGNCTLYSLALAHELTKKGLHPEVVIFPSSKPAHDKGHSGLRIIQDNRGYFLDAGLTMPFPVPMTEIPLYPFWAGNKQMFLSIQTGSDGPIPYLINLGKGGKIPFMGKEIMLPESFRSEAVDILTDMHKKRRFLKLDHHDRRGNKVIGFSYDRELGSLRIASADGYQRVLDIGQFSIDQTIQREVAAVCAANNINAEFVINELTSLTQ